MRKHRDESTGHLGLNARLTCGYHRSKRFDESLDALRLQLGHAHDGRNLRRVGFGDPWRRSKQHGPHTGRHCQHGPGERAAPGGEPSRSSVLSGHLFFRSSIGRHTLARDASRYVSWKYLTQKALKMQAAVCLGACAHVNGCRKRGDSVPGGRLLCLP